MTKHYNLAKEATYSSSGEVRHPRWTNTFARSNKMRALLSARTEQCVSHNNYNLKWHGIVLDSPRPFTSEFPTLNADKINLCRLHRFFPLRYQRHLVKKMKEI
jgi:hypothetical protein